MDISDFELITILASEGNITRTAARLYTTQSAISYRIKMIEKELNARLFDRGKKGITLTSAGQIVLEYSERFTKEYTELKTALGYDANKDIVGNIRLGTSTTMMLHIMMNTIRQIRTSYPNLSITVSGGNSDKVTEAIKNDQLDMGVVRGNVDWDGEKILLYEEPVCIVTKEPFSLDLMKNETFITHPNSNAKDYILRFWEENKHILHHISTIESIEACLDIVDQGFGFSILPAVSLVGRSDLNYYQIVWGDGEPATRKTWYIINDKIDMKEPRFRVFYEYATKEIPALMEKLIKQLDIKQIRSSEQR